MTRQSITLSKNKAKHIFDEDDDEKAVTIDDETGCAENDYVICPICGAISGEADAKLEAPCDHAASNYIKLSKVTVKKHKSKSSAVLVDLDTCADSIWAQKLQRPYLEQSYLIFSLRQKKRRYRKKIELPVEGCSRPAIHGLLLQQQSIGNSCAFLIVEAKLHFLPATWKSLIRNFCAAAVFGTLLRNRQKRRKDFPERQQFCGTTESLF